LTADSQEHNVALYARALLGMRVSVDMTSFGFSDFVFELSDLGYGVAATVAGSEWVFVEFEEEEAGATESWVEQNALWGV
jgi:hypothetical protein